VAAGWALFDLNGTLVDPSVLAEPLGGASEAPLVLEALEEANRMAMVLTLGGRRAAFKDLFEAALRRALELDGRDAGLAGEALRLLGAMPAFPDAAAALERLRAAGLRLAVLTQSSAHAAERVLRFAGLREAFELVLSADDAGAFKPDGRAYAMALGRVGAEPAGTWFVAGHWWDVAGAAAAGLRTAWISRTDRVYPQAMPDPDIRAPDLAGAVEAIAAAA
jgi:2-haloacid dehalogenase